MVSRRGRKVLSSSAKVIGATASGAVGGAEGGALGALVGEFADRILGGPGGLNLLDDPARELPQGVDSRGLLLRAEYGVVPFQHGREGLLEDLRHWLAADDPAAVRLYTGAGGMGKTRLFIRLCETLRGTDWHAGFLTSQEGRLSPSALDHLLEDWRWLFIVVDYAETRRDSLLELLRQAARVGNRRRVRIALIARDAADWWTELASADADVQALLLGSPDPIPVPSLAEDVRSRTNVFNASVTAFAGKLDKSQEGLRPPDLEKPDFASVLVIQMAALAALDGERLDDASALLDYVLDHERRYWNKGAASVGLPRELNPAVSQAAALATLAGGAETREGARKLIARGPLLEDQPKATVNAIAGLLHDLYPATDKTWLETIRPDLLGEHLVARETAADSAVLDSFLDGADAWQAHNGLTVLTRLAQRDPAQAGWLDRALSNRLDRLAEIALIVAIESGDPIGRVLADVLARDADPELAAKLIRLLPERTVALRETKLEVIRLHLDGLHATPEPVPLQTKRDIAGYASNLAAALSALGHREDALEAAEESERAFRSLAKDHPEEMRPHHAMSLNNLASFLSGLGRREAALERAEEAVAIRRDLASARPDAFRPDLAMSLNNLANFLGGLGRREEALARAEEAVAIRRDLASARPDAFRPDLAMSLITLANFLSGLGRREEALARAEEAVAIYRDLASARPDAFRPDLAMSLNNLATLLGDLGRREEALARAEEAVAVYRDLASARPDAFRPDLATSLITLANFLSNLGRREEALARAEEAVAVYRDLAAARPDAFLPDLAMSLNNLATFLGDLGRREEALERVEEAVAIRRDLAAARPDAFRPDLAGSLNNLATFLSNLGRREEALARAEEAVAIDRDLASARPDAFRPDLAMSLNNLAMFLSGLGRREEALERAEEAVALYRDLASARPDAFRPDLAMSLNNLATFLSNLGRREEALARAEEAVAIRRALAAARPDAFLPDLAVSLGALHQVLRGLERPDDALAAIREAVEIMSGLFLANPRAFAHWMGMMARDYGERCGEAGVEPDAGLLAPIAEAFRALNQEAGAGTAERS